MNYEIRPRAAVREEGAQAFRDGDKDTSNPYFPGETAHMEWCAGFKNEQYWVTASTSA